MDGDRDPDIDMQLDLICGDIKAHALGKMVPLRGKGQRAEVDKNKNATDDADDDANMYGFSWVSSKSSRSVNDQITQDENWWNSASVSLMGDAFGLDYKDYFKTSYPAAKDFGRWTIGQLREEQQAVWCKQTLAYADSLAEKGKYEESIRQYTEALKYDPFSILALVRMAQALEALGRFDSAISRYKEALNLEPENSQVIGLMQRLTKRQDYDFVHIENDEVNSEKEMTKKKRKT